MMAGTVLNRSEPFKVYVKTYVTANRAPYFFLRLWRVCTLDTVWIGAGQSSLNFKICWRCSRPQRIIFEKVPTFVYKFVTGRLLQDKYLILCTSWKTYHPEYLRTFLLINNKTQDSKFDSSFQDTSLVALPKQSQIL